MKNILRILAVLVLTLSGVPGSAQDGRVNRNALGSNFLELNGNLVGFLHSSRGGGISADVITEVVGADQVIRKHIGQPKYEDFNIQFGFALKPDLYNWISETLSGKHTRRNGSIHALDFQFNAVAQRQFTEALITEFTIPECDGSVREPGFLSLKLTPELIRNLPASGNVGKEANRGYQSKRWIRSNFRLLIDGVDTKSVNKIEALTVKQKVTENPVGEDRDPGKEPTTIEFPNLKVTFPASHAEDWNAWFNRFVIQGNNGNEQEKNGSLELLTPDLKTVLARVKFFNLGIFKLEPETVSPKSCDCELCQTVVDGANSADRGRHLTAHLYCERMEIEFPSQPPPDGD